MTFADGQKAGSGSPQELRRRIYRIPQDLLLECLHGRQKLPIPEGFQIVSFWPDHSIEYDYSRIRDRVLCISIEHFSFEPVVFKVPVFDLIEKKAAGRVEVQARRATA